jgi:LemA protein
MLTWLAAGLTAAGLGAVVRVWNRLVAQRNAIREARAQVDAQLQRRHDLVPALVATVREYAGHERRELSRAARARGRAMSLLGGSPRAVGPVENDLTHALEDLTLIAEVYPRLRAHESFLRLQEDLVSAENRIAFARQHHNDSVMRYNDTLQAFPVVILAKLTGLRPAEYLQLELPHASPGVSE